jgi:hypothetical protein
MSSAHFSSLIKVQVLPSVGDLLKRLMFFEFARIINNHAASGAFLASLIPLKKCMRSSMSFYLYVRCLVACSSGVFGFGIGLLCASLTFLAC